MKLNYLNWGQYRKLFYIIHKMYNKSDEMHVYEEIETKEAV